MLICRLPGPQVLSLVKPLSEKLYAAVAFALAFGVFHSCNSRCTYIREKGAKSANKMTRLNKATMRRLGDAPIACYDCRRFDLPLVAHDGAGAGGQPSYRLRDSGAGKGRPGITGSGSNSAAAYVPNYNAKCRVRVGHPGK
jgi:hypothetical protein